MAIKYLLDTNIISELTKQMPNKNVVQKTISSKSESVISSVTWYELLQGLKRMPEGKRKNFISEYIFDDVAKFYYIIPYDKKSAEIQSEIFSVLSKNGLATPYQDTQIASIALANDLTLVTRNVKDFKEIKNFFPLKIENWFE